LLQKPHAGADQLAADLLDKKLDLPIRQRERKKAMAFRILASRLPVFAPQERRNIGSPAFAFVLRRQKILRQKRRLTSECPRIAGGADVADWAMGD
jgi:hypothetical protein